MIMYIKRTVEDAVVRVAASFPCIVIYGPRQVGKSTTVDILFSEKYGKVTLDDPDDRLLAQSNPKLFLETYQWPLIIDEIQKAPNLLDEIKIIIDNQRLKWMKSGSKQQLMYILTGSNRFELQQGISDSLAGRCGIIDMQSFSIAEKYNVKAEPFNPDITHLINAERETDRVYRTRSKIFEDIFKGGMPDICTGTSERNTYFKAYVNTYIEKDVRKLIDASSELKFRNFISIIALRTAQEIHYDSIANDVGIDTNTCKRWISILETSGLIHLLHPYMPNISNRVIKAPKLYFMDTGLCAYLCRWPSSEMLESCAMSGAFFETFIVSEIIKNCFAFGIDPDDFWFYYRDKDKKEVDLLYIEHNDMYPIEIKKGINPTKPNKNFNVLEKYKMNIKPGLIIDTCDKIRPINVNAYHYPAFLV